MHLLYFAKAEPFRQHSWNARNKHEKQRLSKRVCFEKKGKTRAWGKVGSLEAHTSRGQGCLRSWKPWGLLRGFYPFCACSKENGKIGIRVVLEEGFLTTFPFLEGFLCGLQCFEKTTQTILGTALQRGRFSLMLCAWEPHIQVGFSLLKGFF